MDGSDNSMNVLNYFRYGRFQIFLASFSLGSAIMASASLCATDLERATSSTFPKDSNKFPILLIPVGI